MFQISELLEALAFNGRRSFLTLRANEPTPEDAAALLDEVETALQGVSTQEANVIRLAMDGYSSSEIASELGCSRWTVRRILNRLGTRISRRLSETSEESSN
jgi:RNA polymerase sigma factor (sigma-70 family)